MDTDKGIACVPNSIHDTTISFSHCSVKDLLLNVGDQFKEEEIRQVWKEAKPSGGQFDYDAFVTLVKRGPQDEMAQ